MPIKQISIEPVEVNGELAKDPNDYERHGIQLPPAKLATETSPEVIQQAQRLTVGIEEVICEAMKPLPWVIERTLIADTLTLIYGPPKQYKTFLALDMCLSQATGLPFLGRYKVLRRGLVVYAAGEGVAGVGQRVLAWCKDRGVSDINSDTVPFRRTRGPVMIGDGGALQLAAEIAELSEEASLPIVGIYVDTLARNFGGGDENSTKDMNVFISQCDTHLRQRFNTAVIIVHHTGHDRAERARGSSVLQAAVDAQFKVTCEFPDVFYEPDFMKDAEAPQPHVLSVEHVPLGFEDQFGEPVKSVVLRMTDKEISPKFKLTADATLALDLLGSDARDYQSWRYDFMERAENLPIQKGKNKGQKRDNPALRKAWERSVNSLEEKGLIEVERDNALTPINVTAARDTGV